MNEGHTEIQLKDIQLTYSTLPYTREMRVWDKEIMWRRKKRVDGETRGRSPLLFCGIIHLPHIRLAYTWTHLPHSTFSHSPSFYLTLHSFTLLSPYLHSLTSLPSFYLSSLSPVLHFTSFYLAFPLCASSYTTLYIFSLYNPSFYFTLPPRLTSASCYLTQPSLALA